MCGRGGEGGGGGGKQRLRGDPGGRFTEEMTLKCWEFIAKKACKGSNDFLAFFFFQRNGKEHFIENFFLFGGLFPCIFNERGASR